MSKRVANRKGMGASNWRSSRNNMRKNYLERVDTAINDAVSVEAIEQLKSLYNEAKFSVQKLVPKGATKMLSSLVRQRG